MTIPSHSSADLHRHVIDGLADELHCASDEVAEIYLHEVDDLAQGARVSEFIPVLAARRTRDAFRNRRRG
jgi:hypothetical protein